MDLRQMKVFLAAAEEKNFSAAAEKLFMTQQMVSKTISSIEDEIGAPLFIRTTRRIELTETGKVAYQKIRYIADITENYIHDIKETGREDLDVVRIAVFRGLKNWFRDNLLEDLVEIIGKNHLHILLMDDENDNGLIHRGKAEIVLSITDNSVNKKIRSDGDDIFILGKTSMQAVIAESHPWNNKSIISMKDMRSEILLRIEPKEISPEKTIHESYHSASMKVRSCENMDSVLMNVELGNGYAIMPAADELKAGYKVKSIDIANQDDSLYLTAITDKKKKSAKVENVCEYLRKREESIP